MFPINPSSWQASDITKLLHSSFVILFQSSLISLLIMKCMFFLKTTTMVEINLVSKTFVDHLCISLQIRIWSSNSAVARFASCGSVALLFLFLKYFLKQWIIIHSSHPTEVADGDCFLFFLHSSLVVSFSFGILKIVLLEMSNSCFSLLSPINISLGFMLVYPFLYNKNSQTPGKT